MAIEKIKSYDEIDESIWLEDELIKKINEIIDWINSQ